MPKIMADHDVEGHLRVLLAIWTSPEWSDVWQAMLCEVASFERLGISPDVSDAALWRLCQEHGIVLLTANRNAESEESLEETIRSQADKQSLPVLTIADPHRLLSERRYAERVAERVLDYLLDIDKLRGVGRLYVP